VRRGGHSQLEAEAVWRGLDIIDVVRTYLLSRFAELGFLQS
jgi:hypothetical protein